MLVYIPRHIWCKKQVLSAVQVLDILTKKWNASSDTVSVCLWARLACNFSLSKCVFELCRTVKFLFRIMNTITREAVQIFSSCDRGVIELLYSWKAELICIHSQYLERELHQTFRPDVLLKIIVYFFINNEPLIVLFFATIHMDLLYRHWLERKNRAN